MDVMPFRDDDSPQEELDEPDYPYRDDGGTRLHDEHFSAPSRGRDRADSLTLLDILMTRARSIEPENRTSKKQRSQELSGRSVRCEGR